MSKKEKLIKRLKSRPKDFTFHELQTLLECLNFVMVNSGKSSGSAVKFIQGNITIDMHKPHPRKELLEYQIKQTLERLEKEGFI